VLVCSSGLALAQSEAAHVLSAGTPLTFISDATVDVKTVRPGQVFKVHLAGELDLAGTTIAANGTVAQLVVLDRITEPGGVPAIVIAISGFNIRGGELPVTPVRSTVTTVQVGTAFATRTMGSVETNGTHTVIRVPLPFSLPADTPNAAYTPVPARTASSRIFSPPPRRVRSPSPSPTRSPSPSPTPEPDASPSSTP
jgi:hypothetical protein